LIHAQVRNPLGSPALEAIERKSVMFGAMARFWFVLLVEKGRKRTSTLTTLDTKVAMNLK
jgi:hypothetical protein